MDSYLGFEQNALLFAFYWHAGTLRKYTNEPYITHPICVADILMTVPHTEAMLCAAYLHDLVEDTPCTFEDIECEEENHRLPNGTTNLVRWLTDVSKPEDGNRATRKSLDRDHIAKAPADAKTIKLADLIHNTQTILRYDPEFARVYMQEKRLLLDVLAEGHPTLYAQAKKIVDDYYNESS